MKGMRNICFAALAVMAAYSCTSEGHDDLQVPEGKSTLIAEREGLDPQSRTAVQADGKSVWWSVGDEVMVFAGAGSEGCVFRSVESEPGKTAVFKGDIGEASLYYGIYPAVDGLAVSASGEMTVAVPAEQNVEAGSFDAKAFPTVARSAGLSMIFYNVAGGIKFALSEEGVNEIVIKGNGAEDIAGSASVAFENGVPVLKSITDGQKELVLTTPGGFVPGTYYYAVLLPVSLPEGLRIILKHDNGVPDVELVSGKARTIKRGTFGKLEGINAIIPSNGKVRFYLGLDGSLRQALGLVDGSLDAWTVSVNGKVYPLKTDSGDRRYVEVDEAADAKYDAFISNANSAKWYGTSATAGIVVPFSQFWSSTRADFANYPRYAAYSAQTGNILTFCDAVALLNVKISGTAALSSVKVRAIGGDPLSGRANVQEGISELVEQVDWAVINCNNYGSNVSTPNTIPVIIHPGTFSEGLEITVCDASHKMVRQTIYPGTVEAGQVIEVDLDWAPDSHLLFYEGFDNFVWGGDIIGGAGATGYAPDDTKLSYTGGKDRNGYENAYTTVSYDYPGSGFIQPNTWSDVKEATVGTSHQMSASYITSRNIADWKYLYRCQEYHGALGVGLAVNRGVVQLPQLSAAPCAMDAVISFRFCLQEGCQDDLYLQLLYAGHVKSITIDGKPADYTSIYYSTSSRNTISRNNVTIPSSAASPKEWHDCEIVAEHITDATAIYLAGNTTTSGLVHGFYLDEIKVSTIPGTEKKGTLRVLYWNIFNGMWGDQENNFNTFVEWVKKYDPDVCVWCEAATIYGSSGQNPPPNKYLPDGWSALASRYGHNYISLGGVIGGSWAYPQVVTSKYPLATIKKMTTTNVSGKPITRGAGMHRLTVDGKTIDIVTTHTWPFSYAYDVPSSQQSASTAEHGGDKYREFEIDYIISQTVNNASYASTSNWILVGDFNSPSPLDIPIVSGSESDDKFRCQKVILNKTNLKDVMKLMYKDGDFVASTYGEKDRKDYVYVSPAMSEKLVSAFMLNDAWNYVNTKITVGGTEMKLPSDHRPIVVEFDF